MAKLTERINELNGEILELRGEVSKYISCLISKNYLWHFNCHFLIQTISSLFQLVEAKKRISTESSCSCNTNFEAEYQKRLVVSLSLNFIIIILNIANLVIGPKYSTFVMFYLIWFSGILKAAEVMSPRCRWFHTTIVWKSWNCIEYNLSTRKKVKIIRCYQFQVRYLCNI